MDPTECTLRDRTPITLRQAAASDGPGVWLLTRDQCEDGRGQVIEVDEIGTVEATTAKIADFPGLWLLAVGGDGAILGSLEIRRLRPRRVAHNGLLSLGIHPAAQGLGLGRAMTERALAWADAAGLAAIELFMRADNERARALYRSVGFEVMWIRERFIRLPDGAAVDDVVMRREAPG